MTAAFRWRRMLASPNEGGSPGRPARLQWAALPAETTHGTSFTSEYYTQKTRMPRSCPGSVSERVSLQRLRPLFSALPTLGRALLPCALSRAKPLARLVLGLAAAVAPVLFPMLWDGWLEGRVPGASPGPLGRAGQQVLVCALAWQGDGCLVARLPMGF